MTPRQGKADDLESGCQRTGSRMDADDTVSEAGDTNGPV
jgi:hypothetical protein